ncbi:7749_t:CDS:1, partial [Dentiscutata erythropus]
KMPFKKYHTDLENIYAVEKLKKSIMVLEHDVTKIHQNLKRIALEIYYLYESMSLEEEIRK